ncbi:class I SAM-dependent DNA methyltransferase [Butyrivibrio sp. AC2005]|uniref:class I SAM-dependent DNA methyltransferase n=1 Tax=Butyrivibrio sp. AC2005 TaxID=1280672 RepID=UPI00041F3A72|nr:class I SAM-dependent methyltransferase [Butyrivibrio sp. AC2005]
MASLYDSADIYDLIENQERYDAYKEHWKSVLENKNIKSMLDVSIGTGSVTLPITELGVSLSGSDLSETMLDRCRKKASDRDMSVELKNSDFRDLKCWHGNKYDMVASTGNSLAYVSNEDVLKTLEQMDALVSDKGYLYFDLRNWDKILKERNRFLLYNPFFVDDTRVNLVQV